jgi:small subunit ribosomal protein S4
LLAFLERRLDNVIYRVGWAPTRAAARQMVCHSHVTVNNKKMNVASYCVQVGDVVMLKTKATKIPVVAELLKAELESVPGWIERKQGAAKVTRLPERADIKEKLDEQLVVEYYSR